MAGFLIKDTTREEREQIVADSLGNIDAYCDGCMCGITEMYQDYIDGKKELREINMEFNARSDPVKSCRPTCTARYTTKAPQAQMKCIYSHSSSCQASRQPYTVLLNRR